MAYRNDYIKMAGLGRNFQLGDVYDYLNDRITSDSWLNLTSENSMDSVIKVENKFKLKLNCEESENIGNDKWEMMGLDDHLKASTMAGIIDKYKGASNYLKDQSNPGQASRTLILRIKSKEERLDLQKLFNQEVPSLPETNKGTHVVVGITYGAEAYCILAQDLDKQLDEEEAREEANEVLTVIATKIENALADSQDFTSFQSLFDREEKQRQTRMKCRLYADFQTQAVRECSVFDAYKHCLKLKEQVEKATDGKNSKAVPISVQLCPLKNVVNDRTKKVGNILEYRDVDSELVSRCCNIWSELERIMGEAEAVRETIHKSIRPSVRQFSGTILKFRDLLKKNLKNAVIKARDGKDGEDGEEEVGRVMDIAEKHPLFKPSRLEKWLSYKKAESEMMKKMNKVKGVNLFSSQKQLENEISDSRCKYTLVLSVSALDQWTRNILVRMKECIKSNSKLDNEDSDDGETTEEGEEKDGEMPWHMVQRKQQQVLEKLRELAEHVEKNKHLADQVQFFAVIGESQVKGLWCYSVYEFDNVLKGNLSRLPVQPTGLRLQLPPIPSNKTVKNSPSVRVEWDYEDLGYPCHFLVEHRPKGGSENWIQQKTTKPGETQMTINMKDGSPIEIRVAADTCIGRSEYSDVIDNESTADDAENGQLCDSTDNISESSFGKPVVVPQQTSMRRGIELGKCIEMAALGRRFQLGNLYDYRNDNTTDYRLNAESSTQIDDNFKLTVSCEETENVTNWEIMGLDDDDHLKASVTVGLINKFNGASNYLNDRLNSSQANRVLALRVVSRRETLNLPNYVDPSVFKTHLKKSTHVVVGITYGAEAYCVLTHNLVEEDRENAEDALSDLGDKFTEALSEKVDSIRFKHQFDRQEQQRLTQIKCRLYADFQSQAVRVCSVFGAYKHCLKLIEQAGKADGEKRKVVPVSVQLCSLKNVIDSSKSNGEILEYRDVDFDLISCCFNVLGELKRVSGEASEAAVRATTHTHNRSALSQFIDAITEGFTTP